MAKILLVEDDKSLREIYGVRLMAEGYEIVSAGDGEEALATAIKERPDLIVSDVMMPKISGFDMLDILRSTTETKNVKVIMMTALSSDDQRARGEALGADRYLVKSQVGIEDVVRTVHDVLGDGAPGAAPAAANPFDAAPATSAPSPAPQPTPAAAPIPESVIPPAPNSVPQPIPTPTTPPVINTPPLEPMPVQSPVMTPPTPPVSEPVIPITPPIMPPAPAAPSTLPEPTAPFSSPAPASLGNRVIEPLNAGSPTPSTDITAQINQELNGSPVTTPDPVAAPPVTPPVSEPTNP